MSKVKELLGFRTKKEKIETPIEDWDIYPTHLVISNGYWTISTIVGEGSKNKK
tara:strand:+ start:464 stop:622 length:159 start_codon:yes stop_codon:yes gene_type:complete